MSVNQGLQRHAHVFGKVFSRRVELHHTTSSVVLGMPDDLICCGPIEAQSEGWFVLPHLPRDVVTTAQLVAEALAVGVQDEAADAAQGLGRQELHFGIRIVGLHQTSRMHLTGLDDWMLYRDLILWPGYYLLCCVMVFEQIFFRTCFIMFYLNDVLDSSFWASFPKPRHLNPFQINGGGANGLPHLDGITSAMLSVCGGQVQKIRSVGGQ